MYVPLHHVNSVYVKLNFRLVDRTPRWSRYCCIDFPLRTSRCFVVAEQCALSQDAYISDISDRSTSKYTRTMRRVQLSVSHKSKCDTE